MDELPCLHVNVIRSLLPALGQQFSDANASPTQSCCRTLSGYGLADIWPRLSQGCCQALS